MEYRELLSECSKRGELPQVRLTETPRSSSLFQFGDIKKGDCGKVTMITALGVEICIKGRYIWLRLEGNEGLAHNTIRIIEIL